jgi:hypothetical protein
MRLTQGSTVDPLWVVDFLPTHAFRLSCFSHICSLRVWLLVPHLFSRAGSAFHSTHAVGVRLQFSVYGSQFYWGRGAFNMPGSCAGLCSWGVSREVPCGICGSPVRSTGLHRQLWNWLAGRNGVLLFSRKIFPGTGFSKVGCRETFHGLGVWDFSEFDSGWFSNFL